MIPVIVENLRSIITLSIFIIILTIQHYGKYAIAQGFAFFIIRISNVGLSTGYELFFENNEVLKMIRITI